MADGLPAALRRVDACGRDDRSVACVEHADPGLDPVSGCQDGAVDGEERQPLEAGLGQQHAIERVAVLQPHEAPHAPRVRGGDRQCLEPAGLHDIGQVVFAQFKPKEFAKALAECRTDNAPLHEKEHAIIGHDPWLTRGFDVIRAADDQAAWRGAHIATALTGALQDIDVTCHKGI